MRHVIAILLLISCGPSHSAKPAGSSPLVPALRAKYASWLAELHDTGAYAIANTNTLELDSATGTTNNYYWGGDFELASKPTWAY